MTKNHLLLLFLLLAVAFPRQAVAITTDGTDDDGSELVFSYDLGDTGQYTYGTNRKENYDAAIHMADPRLTGLQVAGVRIPLPGGQDLQNLRVWLASALTLDSDGMNAPDVATVEATAADGLVEVHFDTPYTLTEAGIYVGYSFDIDELTDANKKPLQLTWADAAEGFYLHTSRTYRKWDAHSSLGALSMQVLLTGADADDALLHPAAHTHVQAGQPAALHVDVENLGSHGVRSVDFLYEVAGQTGTLHSDLPSPIAPLFGKQTRTTVLLPAVAESGDYDLTLTLTHVNGVPRQAEPAAAQLHVHNFIARHRALLEEYTGTWCGYCPTGFVGLEHTHELFPDDFIGVSYHNRDPMEFTYSFANNVEGFPDAWLDRYVQTNPYTGDTPDGRYHMDQRWLQECEVMVPADISVQAALTDEAAGEVTVRATARFTDDVDDAPYQLSFILVANGLTGTSDEWLQTNYYCRAENRGGYPDDDMKPFTQGTEKMGGLTFNFVAVAWSGRGGVEGSLPASLLKETDYSFDHTFRLDDVRNTAGAPIIQDLGKLTAVALIVDKQTGRVVNANKAHVDTSSTALTAPHADTAGRSQCYAADGRRLTRPQRGLSLVRMADGTVVKVVNRR